MLNKKKDSEYTINDLKKANNELFDLLKEIKKEAKINRNRMVLDVIDTLDLNLDYKSVLFQNLTPSDINDLMKLTNIMKSALFDSQELLRKGTEYGVKLSFDRVISLQKDRTINKSPFLVKNYYEFENNLWKVIKLRELAYGEITRLRKKQDEITKSALNEADPMMRVRYFEDIRVLENDILRLEKEAHEYDVVQTTLHSDEVLKNVLKEYSSSKQELVKLETFEETVNKYSGGK